MSKLLPDSSPPQPLSLDYDYDEEIYDRKQEEVEEDEEKQMEAVEDDVDMRIELINESEEKPSSFDLVGPSAVNTDYDKKTEEDEEEKQMETVKNDVEMRIELIGESEEKVPSFDLVGPGDVNTDDYAKKTEDRRDVGPLEERKFEGQDGNLEVEIDNKLTESEGRKGKGSMEKDEKVNEKFTTPPPSKDKGSKGRGKRKTSGALKFPRKKKELIIDEKIDQEKLLPGPVGDDKAVVSSGDKEQSGELNNDAKQVAAESNEEQIVGDVKIVNVVASTEVVSDVIDKKIELRSVTIYSDPVGENHNQATTVGDDGELKHEKGEIADEVKKEKDACVVDGGAQSDKGLSGEDEKIWKKMGAIRAIVGYKGPKGDSYMEELKALYLFTGIEPPADSADFQNKLCFLMSVIGLK
ncbi:hypothetical protein CASFOL_006533 [Castilleja foliolosa]|uniref:Uncharacterized protein n=1 Tax=Castilleja foliolosa TaxID=1961234 RepID=A0ABD3E6M2_9LAMI